METTVTGNKAYYIGEDITLDCHFHPEEVTHGYDITITWQTPEYIVTGINLTRLVILNTSTF